MIFATKGYSDYRDKVEQFLKDEHTRQLSEKDVTIRQLRLELANEKAESERMRFVLMPLGSPAGATYVAKFGNTPEPPKQTEVLDWRTPLTKMLEEEEHGTHGAGRKEVHESSADDVAQPLSGE